MQSKVARMQPEVERIQSKVARIELQVARIQPKVERMQPKVERIQSKLKRFQLNFLTYNIISLLKFPKMEKLEEMVRGKEVLFMIEKEAWSLHGILGMIIIGMLAVCAVLSFLHHHYVIGLLLFIATLLFLTSFTFIYPNEAKLITFYHAYMGTIRRPGLMFTVPLTKKQSISLRNESLHVKEIIVTSMDGKTWVMQLFIQYKVVDIAKALYEVEDYAAFMKEQSVTALKILMTKYLNETEIAKEQFDEIINLLENEIKSRVEEAGIELLEANITNMMMKT